MYELAGPLFVQWAQVMTEWNGFYIYWSLAWTRRLPEGIMVVHQLPPYSEVIEFGDGVPFPFFFFFGYGALSFPLYSYYLVAVWHMLRPRVISRLVGGSLVPAKLFSFPRFLRCFLFKPLGVFSLHLFLQNSSHLVSLCSEFSASLGFHCCNFRAYLLPLLVSLPFSGTPLYFSCFLFPL